MQRKSSTNGRNRAASIRNPTRNNEAANSPHGITPFSALAVFAGVKNPEMMRFWTVLADLGNGVSSTLVSPVLLIASSVFYFDLRVRKEAFDLQFMMDPQSEQITPPSSSGIPSILS